MNRTHFAPHPPPRHLVLDTNIWLDWLVFDDPSIAPIRAAAETGDAKIFMTPACEQELARVLGYPMRKAPLSPAAQAACLAQCHLWTRMHVPAAGPAPGTGTEPLAALPTCKDPDDQKFLELARDCNADYLVTKDRDLLIFARRKYQYLPFRVITPREFTDVLSPV